MCTGKDEEEEYDKRVAIVVQLFNMHETGKEHDFCTQPSIQTSTGNIF